MYMLNFDTYVNVLLRKILILIITYSNQSK